MLTLLSRNWWLFTLRGLAAILFGILAIIWPDVTLTFLVLLFGSYALVDGLLAIFAALTNTSGERRWWFLFEGFVSVAIGVITFIWPAITGLALLYVIAAWAILTGILEIVAAIQLRRVISNEWWLILSGVASIVFGAAVALFPGAGALGILWFIAAYALVFGVSLVALSLKIRNLGYVVEQPRGAFSS